MVYRSPLNKDEGDLETGTRVCRICLDRKPMPEFFWTGQKRYRSRVCKVCWNSRAQASRAENPDKYRRNGQVRNLRVKYGLTEKGYNDLLNDQGHRCAICRSPLGVSVHVDHDHETGAVRGILCFVCNTALGKFRDSVEILQAAIAYLTRPLPVVETRPRGLTPEERRAARSSARRGQGSKRTVSHSRAVRGELNPGTSLTDQNVRDIRRRYAAGGISQHQLATEYGCTQSTISLIVLRRSWQHVEDAP